MFLVIFIHYFPLIPFPLNPSHFMPFLLCDPVSLTRLMCIHMEIYLVGERRQLKSGSNAKENESLYQ